MTVCSTTKGQAAKTTSFTTRKGTVIWSETWTNPILNSIVSNIKQTQWHMNKVKKDSRWFWVAVVAGAKKKNVLADYPEIYQGHLGNKENLISSPNIHSGENRGSRLSIYSWLTWVSMQMQRRYERAERLKDKAAIKRLEFQLRQNT